MNPPRRGLLLAAGVVFLLALGLPWGRTPLLPGTYLPGNNYLTLDFEGDLVFNYQPGFYLPGVGGAVVAGYGESARVTGVAGAVLICLAIRRRRRQLALVALGVASLGVVLGLDRGLGVGRIAYALAIALAALGSGLPVRTRPA